MGEHRIKEGRKGGTRPAHRASAKSWTSVMILSREAWDAGQTVVLPHSLKIVARAEQTLFKASGLSMIDQAMAGPAAGGARPSKSRFFPLPFFVGAMVVKRGKNSSRVDGGGWSSKRKER